MPRPILTSLAAIKAHKPCLGGYATLSRWLRARGVTAPDQRFPLAWVLNSNGRTDTLWALRATSPVLARLVSCDAAESAVHFFEYRSPGDRRPRTAIETARRFAVGLATDEDRRDAHRAALAAASAVTGYGAFAAAHAAASAAGDGSIAAYAAADSPLRLRAWLMGHLPPAAEPYREIIHAGPWLGEEEP